MQIETSLEDGIVDSSSDNLGIEELVNKPSNHKAIHTRNYIILNGLIGLMSAIIGCSDPKDETNTHSNLRNPLAGGEFTIMPYEFPTSIDKMMISVNGRVIKISMSMDYNSERVYRDKYNLIKYLVGVDAISQEGDGGFKVPLQQVLSSPTQALFILSFDPKNWETTSITFYNGNSQEFLRSFNRQKEPAILYAYSSNIKLTDNYLFIAMARVFLEKGRVRFGRSYGDHYGPFNVPANKPLDILSH